MVYFLAVSILRVVKIRVIIERNCSCLFMFEFYCIRSKKISKTMGFLCHLTKERQGNSWMKEDPYQNIHFLAMNRALRWGFLQYYLQEMHLL